MTVEVNSREVTVTGKRGTLHRSFKHLNLDIQRINNGRAIRVDLWFGTRKQGACIRTVCSHIQNMITGVTKGFKYKMRFCYAHFPINVTLADRTVEVRNYIGDKRVSPRRAGSCFPFLPVLGFVADKHATMCVCVCVRACVRWSTGAPRAAPRRCGLRAHS